MRHRRMRSILGLIVVALLVGCSGPATSSAPAQTDSLASSPPPASPTRQSAANSAPAIVTATAADTFAAVVNPTAATAPTDQTAPSTSPPASTTIPSPVPTATARSFPAATARPTPTAQPTPTLLPRLSDAYLDPVGTLYVAFRDVTGSELNSNSQAGQLLLSRVSGIQHLYHLVTADVGYFNADTTAYYDWIVAYLQTFFTNQPAFNVGATNQHVRAQIQAALFDPASDIGLRIRSIEDGSDPQFIAPGTTAYWIYLIDPITDPLWMTPMSIDVSTRAFQRDAEAYARDVAYGTTTGDFGSYLADQDDVDIWLPYEQIGKASTPTATPTTAPQPTATPVPATGGIPADGAILYDRPLSEWYSDESDLGWRKATATSLHIGVYGGNGHTGAAWTQESDFSDISASVDVREVTTGTESIGCISVRHDVASGEYQLCLLSDGRSWATFDFADDNGEWQTEVLLDAQQRGGAHPASQWNTLKIIVKGSRLWYLINDTLIGTATHEARSAGDVDLHVTNWDANTGEWEFKNLVIRAVS